MTETWKKTSTTLCCSCIHYNLFQLRLGERWGTPRTGHRCAAELTHTDNNSHSCAPTANLESPVYLTSLSLDSGIKPTHTQGGRENLWANKDLFLSPWRDFHHRTVPDFQGLEIKPIAPGFLSVLSLYKNKIDHFFLFFAWGVFYMQ